MKVLPPHLYYRHGIAQGVDPAILERASAERARLKAQGAYPLLSLAQLAHETGASYTYLREVVSRARDPYQDIAIPKAGGDTRAISAPEPILMDVQRWVLTHLLKRLPGHPASFAYRPGGSIVHCAEQHVGASWMVKMDLHDFFATVTEVSVYRVFRRLGYAKLISFELARITTRARNARYAPWLSPDRAIGAYSVDTPGVLPQGGPTSGQLANAAAARMDRLIQGYALRARLTYTRYSDDLVFSSHAEFRRADAVAVIQEVSGLTRAAGFSPHRSKSRIVPPGARRVVLGLLVDESVRLLPEHRRRIEVHIRGCEQFGLARHADFRGFDSVFSFINHLDGWISFALGVERERATGWRRRLNHVLDEAGLPHAIPPANRETDMPTFI